MEKRVLIAVTLSILVILLYPLILAKINPELVKQPQRKVQEIDKTAVVESLKPSTVKNASPSNAESVNISTDRYELDITNIGGSLSRVLIKDAKRKSNITLVNNAIFQSGLLSLDGKGVLSDIYSQGFAIHNSGKTMSFDTKDLKIEKTISLAKDAYGLEAVIKITNKTSLGQNLSFDITAGSNISKTEMLESRYIELDIHYKDASVKKLTGNKLLNYNRLYKDDIDWIALKNKYYAIIAKPDFNTKGVFTKNISGESVLGFIVEDDALAPNEIKMYKINFYIGPMEIKELEKLDPDFSKALNFGFLTSISLVLLSILQFFYSILHNYGISILLLTLCINLFLYPLTFKSLKSMQKLQELQPQIEKIRAECKDNPARLNKEIMELYRRYNVNPMGGCLPMLLQMPVFIALYNTLSRSVELKNAGFLWIKDLSMPDAFFKLSSSIPLLGNSINLLPILMIGAMILQQKISQINTGGSIQTEQQKLMANIMPIMFGFIFYSLPSGLVLYWLTSTLISSGMQFILFRKKV